MPQYKVPQNIDMQDRIVGPLTLFQFVYLLAGGMIFYATLKSPGAADVVLVGAPAALLALALAFIKINDLPFSRFVWSLITFIFNPKKRVWHRGEGSPTIQLTQEAKPTAKVMRKTLDPLALKKLTEELDK